MIQVNRPFPEIADFITHKAFPQLHFTLSVFTCFKYRISFLNFFKFSFK